MKTLLSALIDGHEVVTHIGEAAVDPMATALKLKALLSDLPEWASIALLEGEIDARRQQAVDAFSAMFGHAPNTLASQAEAAYWGKLVDDANADVAALNAKTVPLRATLESKRAVLYAAHAVYCQPGPSPVGTEVLIADDLAAPLQAKFDALTTEQKLAVTGEVLPDLRGVRYWRDPAGKWAAGVVTRLGDLLPADAVRETELSDVSRAEIATQQEAARVAALSPDARATEKAVILSGLADEAVRLADKAKITGEAFDGAAWYAAKKADVDSKYA